MRTEQQDGTAVDAGGAAIPAQRGPGGESGARRAAPAEPDGQEAWAARSRVVLTPIAAPSILGLFGFAGATFMVASLQAGWWGGTMASGLAEATIAPFALFFGGLAQFVAGMWSYRARDAIATAMHGTWGSFWLGYGLLVLLVTGGVLPSSVLESTAIGYWFIVLSVVTIFGALAALGENLGLFAVLGLLAAGSVLLAIGFVGGQGIMINAGGWVLVASAAAAFYTAGAMMLAEGFKRTVLPLGHLNKDRNIPGRKPTDPISYAAGMPGSKVGQ
jgi:succinate-acetate transporter protein